MGLRTSSDSVLSEVSRIHTAGKKPLTTTMAAAMSRSARALKRFSGCLMHFSRCGAGKSR